MMIYARKAGVDIHGFYVPHPLRPIDENFHSDTALVFCSVSTTDFDGSPT